MLVNVIGGCKGARFALSCISRTPPGTFCVLYIHLVNDKFEHLFVSQLWWFGPKLHLLFLIFYAYGTFAVLYISGLKYIFTYNFYQLW